MNPIGELWGLLGNLTPDRRKLVEKEYAKARLTAGDRGASSHVLGMLTDAERAHDPLDKLPNEPAHAAKPARQVSSGRPSLASQKRTETTVAVPRRA